MLKGLNRTAIEQARENLKQAERALALAETADAGALCPHPLVIAIAEIENAKRYASAALKG